MAKSRKSAKMTPGKVKQLQSACDVIIKHYSDVLSVWGRATPEQKKLFLDNSPLLTSLLDWSNQWRQ